MWWRRVPVRSIVKRTVLAAAAVQGATLLTLVAIDMYRKRGRTPAIFPRLPPRSITSGGSEVTVYTYGEDLYRDMLHAIRHAKHEIFFETFIWKSDEIGQAFKTALIEAADRGVKVYVVFDEFANLVVPRSFFRLPPNINVRRHPMIASGFRFPRNSGRDHRKLLVVDHDAAVVASTPSATCMRPTGATPTPGSPATSSGTCATRSSTTGTCSPTTRSARRSRTPEA